MGAVNKQVFYGQADHKGLLQPPYGQGIVIFSTKKLTLTYLTIL